MTKRALIFGVAGQDGSYLAESLLADGYEVHGTVRTSAQAMKKNDVHKHVDVDLTSYLARYETRKLVRGIQPDEVYHLAAPSHVGESFDFPVRTMEAIVTGTAHVLEAVRMFAPEAHVYLAGSVDMFGSGGGPRSPYGVAKFAMQQLGCVYRAVHNMHVSTGVMTSHESPRRSLKFLTRKVTMAVARIKCSGGEANLSLGRLNMFRDWFHAKDAVTAMRMMVNAERPGDYHIRGRHPRLVSDFVEAAFAVAGLKADDFVTYDMALNRSVDVNHTVIPVDMMELPGWSPTISFEDIVREMVENDIAILKILKGEKT